MDENPLLDFLLADLAWGKKPRVRVATPSREEVIEHVMQRWDGVFGALAESERQDRAIEEEDQRVRAIAFAPPVGDAPLLGLSAQIESADEAFAREIELAREVCEDAEVDARVVSVPIAPLPFGAKESE